MDINLDEAGSCEETHLNAIYISGNLEKGIAYVPRAFDHGERALICSTYRFPKRELAKSKVALSYSRIASDSDLKIWPLKDSLNFESESDLGKEVSRLYSERQRIKKTLGRITHKFDGVSNQIYVDGIPV